MDFSPVLKTIIPTVASLLGSPLAGLAISEVGKALGMDQPTMSKVKDVLSQGQLNADQIVALKQAEQALQVRMRELDISEEQLAATDRDSARQREVSIKDRMPGILAIAVTIGFFSILTVLLTIGKPDHGGDALLVMLGSLGTAWASIISYYFGSSSGSAFKNGMIDKLTQKS